MTQTTAVNWKAYRVYKTGCGSEPDETFGYYSTRAKAEMTALQHLGDPMCKHESICVEEIEIES